jgi:MFS family permease
LGFGIFYAMVNVGASFGPIVAGRLRAISWNWAFIAAAISIFLMLVITLFFYKEPEREFEGITLKQKFKDMGTALSDIKFAVFLILLGIFFWLPFWSFFNLLAVYVDTNLNTAQLYQQIKSVLGSGVANFLSHEKDGTRVLLGETIAHTGFIIMFLQIFVSRIAEKFKAMPAFLTGLFIAALGFLLLGYACVGSSAWVFLGILLFAFGEMISSPRIQEYITWIAPREKAGLYMGSNFLAVGLGGALSGVTYTSLYGYFGNIGHPEYIWFTMAGHTILGILALWIFIKLVGEFTELEE